MPEKKTPQLKDPELYDSLRNDGAPKEKAARIGSKAARSLSSIEPGQLTDRPKE